MCAIFNNESDSLYEREVLCMTDHFSIEYFSVIKLFNGPGILINMDSELKTVNGMDIIILEEFEELYLIGKAFYLLPKIRKGDGIFLLSIDNGKEEIEHETIEGMKTYNDRENHHSSISNNTICMFPKIIVDDGNRTESLYMITKDMEINYKMAKA
eukprot:GHVP01068564.1.p1 GENE.GHVP01068564.1~~GHVP01068564.1.p1  ORF type:complete len:156 (-),score=16.76 GHVP01068564.1:759-1226(-)